MRDSAASVRNPHLGTVRRGMRQAYAGFDTGHVSRTRRFLRTARRLARTLAYVLRKIARTISRRTGIGAAFRAFRKTYYWRLPTRALLLASAILGQVFAPLTRGVRQALSSIAGTFRGRILGLKSGTIRLLSQNRNDVRHWVEDFAEFFSDAVHSRTAIRYLDFVARLATNRKPLLARAFFKVGAWFLDLAMATNLYAGHKERALRIARIANVTYRSHVRHRTAALCRMYFFTLNQTARLDLVAREVPTREKIGDFTLNRLIGIAHLYNLNPRLAKFYFNRACKIHGGDYFTFRSIGRAHLIDGQLKKAEKAFAKSVAVAPYSSMAHQNYAGRYDIASYVPPKWELDEAGALLIYDNYGQFAEDLFLQGRFDDSFRFYQKMLDHQESLASGVDLPGKLKAKLAKACKRYDPALPTRLLPWEWVIQFGHIGLLDSYLKMTRLGMYPRANYVVLAPRDKVANEAFLKHWKQQVLLVRDPDLIMALFPYQRHFGDNFMAYPGNDEMAEPWTRAAARAQIEWSKKKRPPLISLSAKQKSRGERALRKLGIPEGAWYIGLHVREGGYYGESQGSISDHRNSHIEDYFPAIDEIRGRGGYVIRMGDTSMRPLVAREGVIDYAHSTRKTPELDLFILESSEFVVGTTSGLTTACLSFGNKMLLTNCISNDWQLWTGDTDFIFKRIHDVREGRDLPLGECFTAPVQGYLINNIVMERHGLEALPNTADEILDAVIYKLDIVEGKRTRPGDTDPIMAAYHKAMSKNPQMFGAARPVPAFLERHREALFKLPSDGEAHYVAARNGRGLFNGVRPKDLIRPPKKPGAAQPQISLDDDHSLPDDARRELTGLPIPIGTVAEKT